MNERDDILLALASKLSVRARELLLADSARLRTNNDRTYEFLAKPRVRNPLRLKYEIERENQTVPKAWFGESQHEVLRALRFHPSGIYRVDSFRVGRWIGPDGVITCSRTKSEHFDGSLLLGASFEDGSEVRVGPANYESRFEPDVRFEVGGGDLADDYGRALELAASHMHQTGARPLYRFEDPELDRLAIQFYWEHRVPIVGTALRIGSRAADWVRDKLEDAEPMLDNFLEKQTRKGEESIEQRAHVGYDSIVYVCGGCSKNARVPFDKLGAMARCGHCRASFETTGYPLDAETATALQELIKSSPIPLLVDFWAGWCAPCVFSMPQLVEAAAQSKGRFAIVRVNAHRLETASEKHRVEALPTMLRIEHGYETGREVGAKQANAIIEFALDQPAGESSVENESSS